jgi:hypothetical protein
MLLNVFYYIPFSTKPEVLFMHIKNRFFDYVNSVFLARQLGKKSYYARTQLISTTAKMGLWASQINTKYFDTIKQENLLLFVKESKTLAYLVGLLYDKNENIKENALLVLLKDDSYDFSLALNKETLDIEALDFALESILGQIDVSVYQPKEIRDFYEYLCLYRSVCLSFMSVQKSVASEDFDVFNHSRF